MSADITYQNVVHKRMGGQMFVIPTGCTGVVESSGVFNIESGGKVVFDSGSTMTMNNSLNLASGSSMNIASGAAINIASGGALALAGTNYIDTGGRIVDQYETKTSASLTTGYGGELSAYGVSYVMGNNTSSQTNYDIPVGVTNVRKTIALLPRTSTGVVVFTATTGVVLAASTGSTWKTVTADEYQGGTISMIASSSGVWQVISKTTSLTIA